MPELPEVETMRRGIAPIAGARIADVMRTPCRQKALCVEPRIDRLRRRVTDRTIREVGRVGKRVVLRLDSDERLVFEPRMTGLVLLANPPDPEHLRLRMELTQAPVRELLYWDRRGLGSVRLFDANEFQANFGPTKLGPDALNVTAGIYCEKLSDSRRAIKVAMLDQRAIAGIGNLYASEILHVAGIHPDRQCNRMHARQWEALAAATRHVLAEAIRYEGSTLSDGTYRNALNKQGGYQNHHRVYARAGARCPSCSSGKIARTVQAQRSTFHCPRCQRKTGARLPLASV